MRSVLIIAGIAVLLAACEPRIFIHGYVPVPEVIEEVEPGVQNQIEVSRLLGSPSTTSVFGKNVWMYITDRVEHFAFYKPEILSRDVLAISFDANGVVEEIVTLTLVDGIVIDPVSRTTPTYGKEFGLLEQLLGNIGRFDTPGGVSGTATP